MSGRDRIGRHDLAAKLLFLPGASGNTEFWKPVAAHLRHPGAPTFVAWPVAALGAEDWRVEHRRRSPGVPSWFVDEREDLAKRLPEIEVPVLLLWGDADPISPVAVGRRLAELFPRAELVVVPGGTHDLVLGARGGDRAPHRGASVRVMQATRCRP